MQGNRLSLGPARDRLFMNNVAGESRDQDATENKLKYFLNRHLVNTMEPIYLCIMEWLKICTKSDTDEMIELLISPNFFVVTSDP